MKIKVSKNIWAEEFETGEDIKEYMSNNIYCVNCIEFDFVMGSMGICGNKTGCLCKRMVDCFDIVCNENKIPKILYAGLTENLQHFKAEYQFEYKLPYCIIFSK